MKKLLLCTAFGLISNFACAFTLDVAVTIEQKSVNETFTFDEQELKNKRHLEERYSGEDFNFRTRIAQIPGDKLGVEFVFTNLDGELISAPVLVLSWNELGKITLATNDIPTFELTVLATR